MILFTRLTSSSGPLAKRIGIDGDGLSVVPAASMTEGEAERLRVKTLHEVGDVVRGLEQNQAIIWGDFQRAADRVKVVTKGNTSNGSISRSKDCFSWIGGEAVFPVDYDGEQSIAFEKICESLAVVFPPFAKAGHVRVPSSSGGLMNADGSKRDDSTGKRLLFVVKDGRDIERFSNVLFDLSWMHGFGSIKISVTGEPLLRSVFDKAVHSCERLDLLASPILSDGLKQQREIVIVDGPALDTRKLSDVSSDEQIEIKKAQADAKRAVSGKCIEIRQRYQKRERDRLIEKGIDPDTARRTVESRMTGTLVGSDVLELDDRGDITVAKILAAPSTFHGLTLKNPTEPEAGKNKAAIFFNDPDTVIHSNLHGGQNYVLRHDFGSLTDLVDALPDDHPPEVGRLIALSELTEVEIEAILRKIATKTGATLKALKSDLIGLSKKSALTHHAMAVRFVEELGILKYDEGVIWRPTDAHIWNELPVEKIQERIGEMFNDQPLCRKQSDYRQIMNQIQNVTAEKNFFRKSPFGIAGPNGFVTIDDETGKLISVPLRPSHRQKFAVQYDPTLKNPEPEMMLDFLSECFKDVETQTQIDRIQEAVGVALAGNGWTFERAFFLIGPGNSGKSTTMRIIERFFPEHLIAAPSSETLNKEYSLAALATAKLIVFGEMDRTFLGGTFKSLTGRDLLQGRHPTHRPFKFKCAATCFGLTNKFPKLHDTSIAMMRRLEVLSFPHSRAAAGLMNKNIRNLDRQITDHDAGDLVGWGLVGGARATKRNDITESKTSARMKLKWQAQSDPLDAFIADPDRINVGKDLKCRSSDFNDCFESWCEENNIRRTPSRIEITQLMEDRGFPRRKTSDHFFHGLEVLIVTSY